MSMKPSSSNSTSFVIDFDNDTSRKTTKIPEKFVRRHWRNLSLPINTSIARVQAPKLFNNTTGINEVNGTSQSSGDEYIEGKISGISINKKEQCSDSSSEGGTYTLDKNDEETNNARKSINKVFGVREVCEVKNKSFLINEWVKASSPLSPVPVRSYVSLRLERSSSKIPSPILARRNSNNSTPPVRNGKSSPQNVLCINKNLSVLPSDKKEDGLSLGTECYLRETENIVSLMQKRLDSGTDSSDTENSKILSSADDKNTDTKPLSTRYNRAFSLRRDRLNKSNLEIKTSIPIRKNIEMSSNGRECNNNDFGYSPKLQQQSSTTNLHRPIGQLSSSLFSVKKQLKDFKNVVTSTAKGRNVKNSIGGNKTTTKTGNRSNSTLSPQEIEFQNWKRRKSYDPMKAAAEGKRKTLEKKQNVSNLMSRSVSSTLGNCNSVSRSASFHVSQRQEDELEGYTSAEENELYNGLDKDDEWKLPKPPSTSLQNSPPGSRLSLLSNASSSSLLFSNLESVDSATVNAVMQLSVKMKQASCRIVERLSSTITDDGKKNILYNEMKQLTRCDNAPLPSYQLSFALENFKEIYNVIQALERVL